MLIGQVEQATGLSRDTIRYYERKGIIDAPERRPNGYKEYAGTVVDRLRFAKEMQQCGFTLREIGSCLQQWANATPTCAETRPHFRQQVAALDERIADLTRMRERLQDLVSVCDGKDDSVCRIVAERITA